MLKVNLKVRRGEKNFSYNSDFPGGSLTVIIGPSGSGKSSLLLALAGLIPARGTCSFGGKSFEEEPPENRPLSLLFQEHNLFDHLTVFQNTALAFSDNPSRIRPDQKEAVEEMLYRTGLKEKSRTLPTRLSGGQRQRVALARALLREKPLLCLDEPFNNLDPGLRRDLHVLTSRMQRTGKLTGLLVSHHPEEAALIADQMIFLGEDGRCIAGRPEEILESSDPAIRSYLKGGSPEKTEV